MVTVGRVGYMKQNKCLIRWCRGVFNLTLINGYCKRVEIDKAIDLVREMSLKQLKPGIVTYTTVLQGLFRVGRFSHAQKMYDEMRVLGFKPDTHSHTYCIMLDGLCKNGHVEEALVFLQELERKNVDLSCSMYDVVIAGLCKKGKLDIAQDIFNNCVF
ncbi:hypothetical protein KY289_002102 [Solanum tuberosum]|nr:hypothetical protein KY284_001990 [Solanum tuberosum]KAH0730914.1 hypothetical protein KY289_002102 [Solanum tuberosum]